MVGDALKIGDLVELGKNRYSMETYCMDNRFGMVLATRNDTAKGKVHLILWSLPQEILWAGELELQRIG